MGLNDTPSANRIHIGFFGCRNAGKSSVVNAITGQDLAVVSDTPGTTTDPVRKAMELLPLGPVMIIDTPGFDLLEQVPEPKENEIYVSALTGEGVEDCKEKMGKMVCVENRTVPIVKDLIQPSDFVILVVPIDSSAPKGRSTAADDPGDFRGGCHSRCRQGN